PAPRRPLPASSFLGSLWTAAEKDPRHGVRALRSRRRGKSIIAAHVRGIGSKTAAAVTSSGPASPQILGVPPAPQTGTRPPVVEGKALAKKFGDSVAVDGIDFVVREGECCGFLG